MPENPLALQEPIGKCVMTALAITLRQLASDELCKFPQWACVQNRGTGDAIARVAGHCAPVRRTLQLQRVCDCGGRTPIASMWWFAIVH